MHGQMVGVIPISIALMALWALAMIHIWYDADNVYGNGWFWLILVIIVPVIAIPLYWLMKRFTHRSWKQELETDERSEYKHALWGHLSDSQGDSLGGVGQVKERSGFTAKGFKPYRAEFASEVEDWRRKHQVSSGEGTQSHGGR